MRIAHAFAIAAVFGTAAPAFASFTEFQTGSELASACKAFVASDSVGDDNAVRQDPCRHFIQNFFAIYIQQRERRVVSQIEGTGTGACPESSCCFRMPDFVSYRELSAKIVAFADAHADKTGAKPYDFMTAVLSDAYPCADTPR